MELNYKKEVDQFDKLTEAVIDASSCIYLEKAGCLPLLANTLHLTTLPAISEEIGFPLPGITITPYRTQATTNDLALLDFAAAQNRPLISEDKKLLQRAAKKGLPYYNALMMLIFLYYKEKINSNEYRLFKTKLLQTARYSEKVITYGEKLFTGINNKKP